MRILIIGGVASGVACAARVRRLDEKAKIVIYERFSKVSYGVCGMPLVVSEEIKEKETLDITPMPLLERGLQLEIRLRCEVMKIDRKWKKILVKNIEDGKESWDRYDKLLISTGSSIARPKIEGINNPGIYNFKTHEDLDRMLEISKESKDVLVYGASFIGLELAESFIKRGMKVTIVDPFPFFLSKVYDEDMMIRLVDEFRKRGANVILNTTIKSFKYLEDKKLVRTTLSDSKTIEFDFVAIGSGSLPNSRLAYECGLDCVPGLGTISVNEHMQTTDGDIYAVGDVVNCRNFVTKEDVSWVPLAAPATKQARIAANHMYGESKQISYPGTIGVGTATFFNLTVSNVGVSETKAKKLYKENVLKIITCGDAVPKYMLEDMEWYDEKLNCFKILFHAKTGLILGAQMCGPDGGYINQTVSCLSFAVQMGVTIRALVDLELPYSPHFGHPRHILNQIGLVGSRMLDTFPEKDGVSWDEVVLNKEKYLLVDMRKPKMFKRYHIPGAIHIPFGKLRKEVPKLEDSGKIVVLVCGIGRKAYFGVSALKQRDFENVTYLKGGMYYFERHVLPSLKKK